MSYQSCTITVERQFRDDVCERFPVVVWRNDQGDLTATAAQNVLDREYVHTKDSIIEAPNAEYFFLDGQIIELTEEEIEDAHLLLNQLEKDRVDYIKGAVAGI